MKTQALFSLACAFLVSSCVMIDDPTTNVSADQLRKLYTGNVKVSHMPQWRGENGVVAGAMIFYRDGTYADCGQDMRAEAAKVYRGKWKVVADKKYGALFGTDREEGVFDPEQRDGFYPVHFNAETGVMEEFHWTGGQAGWVTSRLSHFQQSWPVAMLERCPDISVPVDIPINQKQTSDRYLELVKQDPEAVIRN